MYGVYYVVCGMCTKKRRKRIIIMCNNLVTYTTCRLNLQKSILEHPQGIGGRRIICVTEPSGLNPTFKLKSPKRADRTKNKVRMSQVINLIKNYLRF